MSRLPNEDLFEGSKMTFGEHLEELRVALVRSLIGIAIGSIVGFAISNHVIRFVETPLLQALDDYYRRGRRAGRTLAADPQIERPRDRCPQGLPRLHAHPPPGRRGPGTRLAEL